MSLRSFDFVIFHGRLGLSATPERWFDESGTKRIKEIFDKTVFDYPLEKAIKERFLVEYEYHPIVIQLNDEEIQKYERLSYLIAKLYSDDDVDEEEINKLKRKRSLIILKAEEKKYKLFELINPKLTTEDTIVYCAQKEVNFYTRHFSDMGFKVHRFDSNVRHTTERKKIIKCFSEKELQILIAIKCLDEGVDIPSVKNAYLLASTTNPKEFIQRRGRVLRRYRNKDIAILYDFIVLPENIRQKTFLSIAYREMPRFSEFANNARNKFAARNIVRYVLEQYNCEHLLDISPWEVYQEQRIKRMGDVDLDD
jgi:superfamily II DNA or RNA helicase